ncbi:hypothetical protein OE88DRAFT_1668165 [Heliocybe sulcata]|uniref:Uncharacterized protein n=1 Tax=Heliocybe sulcata TaxID=5364 RepID=A0A5C3MNW0_9AGAM|nr:hypothetical protein OE88DRAFT_1668165 [Heliocybe sulcata]
MLRCQPSRHDGHDLRPSATNPAHTSGTRAHRSTRLAQASPEASWLSEPSGTYDIQTLVEQGGQSSPYLDNVPFGTFNITVTNTGAVMSD